LRNKATSEKVLSRRVRLSERPGRIPLRNRISESLQKAETNRLPKR
jgi:hypothetical protein